MFSEFLDLLILGVFIIGEMVYIAITVPFFMTLFIIGIITTVIDGYKGWKLTKPINITLSYIEASYIDVALLLAKMLCGPDIMYMTFWNECKTKSLTLKNKYR